MENLVHGAFALAAAVAALIPILMVRSTAAAIVWLLWIGAWGTLAVMTTIGVFTFDPPILRLAAHLWGQIACGVLLFLLVPSVRRAVRAIPLKGLVRWQIARVIGGFFIVGAAMGEVPMLFAVIAGTGDILVGIAAARTAKAMKTGDPLRPAILHTAFGLSDFAVAIGTAILTVAMIGGPYMMIPLFLVPMAILAHLAVLDRAITQLRDRGLTEQAAPISLPG